MSASVRCSRDVSRFRRESGIHMNAHPNDARDSRMLAELVLIETMQDNEPMPDPIVVGIALGVTMLEVPTRRLAGARGLTTWSGGGYVVEIDETLEEPDRQVVAAHEIGHVCCRLWNVIPREWERFAWLFAGALLVRADVASDLWRTTGDLHEVAKALPHVPPTSVALAIGEHGVADVAVTQWRGIRYTRSRVQMPAETVSMGMAAARSGRSSRPGLARAWRLTDMPGRAAVVVG
jgi:hypothetical protein